MTLNVITMTGKPVTTLKHTCGDSAETLDDVSGFSFQEDQTINDSVVKRNVTAVLITCEDQSIRFSWGTNPTQDGGTGVGHVLAATYSLKLTNAAQIKDFRFINKVNGSNAVLQITPEISSVS